MGRRQGLPVQLPVDQDHQVLPAAQALPVHRVVLQEQAEHRFLLVGLDAGAAIPALRARWQACRRSWRRSPRTARESPARRETFCKASSRGAPSTGWLARLAKQL